MNRRDAVKALMALPGTPLITQVTIAPEDIIVVEFEDSLSDETVTQLKTTLESVWPNRRCLVLANGLHLKVLSQETAGRRYAPPQTEVEITSMEDSKKGQRRFLREDGRVRVQ